MATRTEALPTSTKAKKLSRRKSRHHVPDLAPTTVAINESVIPNIIPPDEEPAETQRTKVQIFLIMTAICMAAFLAALDTTIITAALPTIAKDLKASDSGFAWLGSAYLIGNAASMSLWGKISDIFGRKPILIIANVVFMAGSLVSALAVSLNMLIAGRAVQGVGAGGLIVLANIVVSDIFSQRDRGLYLGLVGLVYSSASVIGPVIGGLFAEDVSWRWCFWVNLPCDGVSLILLFFFLKVHNPRTPMREGLKAIDWFGALTVVGATLMFSLGLELGGVTYPWQSAIVVSLISHGISTFIIFLLIQWKIVKYPIMPLRLFNQRSTAAVFVVVVAQGTAFISTAYFLPFYFQAVLGATPIQSGLWVLPLCGMLALTSIVSGGYIQRSGDYRGVIWFGAIFMTLGFGLFIDLKPYRSWTRIIIYQVIVSLGIGPLFQPTIIAVQAHLHERDIATGTSTISFLRFLSAGVSVVIGEVIFQNQMQKPASYAAMLQSGISADTTKTLAGGGTVSATFLIQTLTPAQQNVVRDVITSSLQKLWIFYTAVAFVGLLAALGVQKKVLSSEHVDARTGLERGVVSVTSLVNKELDV